MQGCQGQCRTGHEAGGWKEQDMGTPQEWMLELIRERKKTRRIHQGRNISIGRRTVLRLLGGVQNTGDTQRNGLGVSHSLPKQKKPTDDLHSVRFKCFQPNDTVI